LLFSGNAVLQLHADVFTQRAIVGLYRKCIILAHPLFAVLLQQKVLDCFITLFHIVVLLNDSDKL